MRKRIKNWNEEYKEDLTSQKFLKVGIRGSGILVMQILII